MTTKIEAAAREIADGPAWFVGGDACYEHVLAILAKQFPPTPTTPAATGGVGEFSDEPGEMKFDLECACVLAQRESDQWDNHDQYRVTGVEPTPASVSIAKSLLAAAKELTAIREQLAAAQARIAELEAKGQKQ